jgi:predicted MFS family arabinose efflux permease
MATNEQSLGREAPLAPPGEVMTVPATDTGQRERLLRLLAAATFLIFFQAFMVAPLLPRLATVFGVAVGTMGLIVPAYLIPYGLATLAYGPLSDRFGRGRVIFASLLAFILLTVLTAAARAPSSLLLIRLLTGLGASGVVPIALALLGDLYPYHARGRPLGWLFGAMAGGMAFGSTAGVWLESFVGWRGLFLGVAILGAVLFALLLPYRSLLRGSPTRPRAAYRTVLTGYWQLLGSGRARRTYGYVLLNSVFHSGVYTWLGLYFNQRYGLDGIGIGLALLGYGVPGFLFGPLIGRAADRWGRRRLVPLGLAIGGVSAAALALDLPVLVAALLVTALSLGYDTTQPLFAGIVTDLSPNKGQAMGLNVFTLFTSFGLGSLLFGGLLGLGLSATLALFGLVELLLAAAAIPLFRAESACWPPVRWGAERAP